MSAAERFLTFLLWEVNMSDRDSLAGRERTIDVELADLGAVDEIRADRLLENASELEDDIGLCLVFDGSLTP